MQHTYATFCAFHMQRIVADVIECGINENAQFRLHSSPTYVHHRHVNRIAACRCVESCPEAILFLVVYSNRALEQCGSSFLMGSTVPACATLGEILLATLLERSPLSFGYNLLFLWCSHCCTLVCFCNVILDSVVSDISCLA